MKKFYLLMVLVLMAAVALSAQNRVNFYGGVYGGMTEFDDYWKGTDAEFGYSIALGNFFHDKFALEFEFIPKYSFDEIRSIKITDPADSTNKIWVDEKLKYDYLAIVIMGKYYPLNDWLEQNMDFIDIRPFITAGFANFSFERKRSENLFIVDYKGSSFILGFGIDWYVIENASFEIHARQFFNNWDSINRFTPSSDNYMLNAGLRYHF